MDETFGTRLRKTAEDVAQRLNDAAVQASVRIGEMREVQRLTAQIRELQRERDRCRFGIADLVVRMFDQGTFVDGLLRPEYQRIKELDKEIARLEQERIEVGTRAAEEAGQPAPTPGTDGPVQMSEATVIPSEQESQSNYGE